MVKSFGSNQNFKSLDKLTTASSINNGIGLGLGIGVGISFSLAGLGIMSKDFQLFGALSGTILILEVRINTYDFTDALFNDAKKGELVERLASVVLPYRLIQNLPDLLEVDFL